MSLLKIDPESELSFTLSASEATPKCTMTLSHSGGTTEAVAFKVRMIRKERGVLCGAQHCGRYLFRVIGMGSNEDYNDARIPGATADVDDRGY
jgi:hypothetical protein